MKTRVAMIFGGKSVEHEVSVISGIQAVLAMDTDKYEVIPVYMTKKNEMYIGSDVGNIEAYKDIKGLLARSQRVIMINENGRVRCFEQGTAHFLQEWPDVAEFICAIAESA